MGYVDQNIKRLCSFYVSDFHLVTMILPYISKGVNEGVKITTILENNIEQNVVTLVEKLNLKNEKDILAIDWNQKEIAKYDEIETKLNEIVKGNKKIEIVVNGSKSYIENVNKILKKYFNTKKFKNKEITILDCYEVTEFNYNIMEILDSHDKILNTSGEKEIEEVFEGYKKAN